jgi:hypothetical protein
MSDAGRRGFADEDLIERDARAEGVELKDVVNLAFHELFERRHYLPEEQP